LITALNGLVVVFVVSSEILRKQRQRKRLSVDKEAETHAVPTEEPHISSVENLP
jgi:hypothetical protein